MKITFKRILLITISCTVMARLGGTGAQAAEHTVAIRDNFFSPKNLTIPPGDTVKWVHQGAGTHTTTSSSGLWNSGLMQHGDDFSVTFSNLGNFPYICQVHGASMSGKITVADTPPPLPDVFLVTLSGTLRTTNESGALVVRSQTAKSFLADCAEEHGREASSLALVYDLEADAIVAVDRTNGSNVCTVVTFVGGVTLSTPDGTHRERQALVLVEDDEDPEGSMIATERSTRGTGGDLLKFSLHGSIQFGMHAYEDEPSKIFSGTFSAGRKFIPGGR